VHTNRLIGLLAGLAVTLVCVAVLAVAQVLQACIGGRRRVPKARRQTLEGF
jgi:hypothetical protein